MQQHHHRVFARCAGAALIAACFAAPAHAIVISYAGDPGRAGDPASWRTAEFLRDWGLRSIGAEFAYAAGYAGAGIKIGAVDSGYFAAHPELDPARYTPVNVGSIAGTYNQAYNDTHGTHVTGTIGASRDGGTATTNFHGVAFNAQLYVGNTGKTDSALFGLPPSNATPAQLIDQAHVANTYRAVNAQGVRILTSSWGSQPSGENYTTMAGLLSAWQFLKQPDTWIQGAFDAARSGTIVMFSAGNSGYPNASARSAASYFDPTLEANWLAVAAIRQTASGGLPGQTLNADGSVNSPGLQLYNQCGVAKWSCVTAPGNAINGSTVTLSGGVPTATYSSLSGTSMAAPHAAGALAIIMERFAYMTNEQALNVMLTTAVQNSSISNAAGTAILNPDAGKRTVVPDSRNGWGTISLRNAMNGPGQFTGRFAVDTQGHSDTWSNDISDTAIQARKLEDQTEAAQWEATKASKGWTAGLPPGASDAERTEYEVGVAREAARNTRVYEGSLAKYGAGTLVLSGNNSFSGGTELHGGVLVGRSATAFGSGGVAVHGGALAGNAVIAGDLLNAGGWIAPGESIGTLSVLGNFVQLAAGGLAMELGGSGVADLLAIGGQATLGGTLALDFLGSEAATSGSYTLLSYDGFSGSFANVLVSGLASGYTTQLVYGADGLSLNVVAVPEPGTWALLLAGLGVVGSLARRRRG